MGKSAALLVVAAASCFWALETRADEAAVRQVLASYAEAFNKQDGGAIASLWTEAGTYTDRATGEKTEGREAIVADINTFFKDHPEAKLTAGVDRVRMVADGVAGVEGQVTLATPGEVTSPVTFTATLVQRDGKWLIDAIEEMPQPQPASSYDALRELEWLVGKWVDDSDDVRVETTFRWTTDRGFLLRSFVKQTADGPTQQGTQVIGWDPRAREIRSWTFNSDGSFGDATWAKDGEKWMIKSSQTLADGRAASGTYVMTRVDDNTLTVQLVGHEIEGEPQPAGEAVRIIRAPAEASAESTPSTNP